MYHTAACFSVQVLLEMCDPVILLIDNTIDKVRNFNEDLC